MNNSYSIHGNSCLNIITINVGYLSAEVISKCRGAEL